MALKEAAALLRVPLPTLHDLLNAGLLASYRIGRRRYITANAAIEFINNRQGNPESAGRKHCAQ
jgi:excisionase family DNA binding protein